MTVTTPRHLALGLLNGLDRKEQFSGTALDELFRRNPSLDQRDRAFVSQLVQGVLRWKRRLDWIIEQASHHPLKKISPPVLNILRLALYQIFFLDRVPDAAAVNEAVKQCKGTHAPHIASFVNGILRRLCREKDRISFPDRDAQPIHFLSVTYSYPEWMIRRWMETWGFEWTEELLKAGNHIPFLTIRTNRLKIDRERLLERLEQEGLTGTRTPYGPEGIRIEEMTGRVDRLTAFRQGLFQVQDEAAQITSYLLSPQPGERILDLCAGFGGKTTHLSELTKDRGCILALDTNRQRLISLDRNSERLGIKSIHPVVADASKSLTGLLSKRFDKILVDAPCSGLGVLSKHPDGKWTKKEEDIKRLAGLQKKIVQQASRLLKDGGTCLYVTCTLSKEENEGVIEDCLKDQKALVLEDMKHHIPEWGRALIDDRGLLRTFPHKHHMDGFFAALLRKKN